MEGLADDIMRDVLTQAGGYDGCVTEFIRVSATVLPASAFIRISPELKNAGRTSAGTPVTLQFLGSDPSLLAANARRAARLNPPGIDLNFGCPVPLVNRNRGGAALLEEPELLHAIAAAVRSAVPSAIPISAKMRLGIKDTQRTLDCARALEAGGISELTVHARTKEDGYRPPARWEWIAAIRETVKLPLIANGEVWTLEDYEAIRSVTGCMDVMLGRGAVADPLLASRIRHRQSALPEDDWPKLKSLIFDFWERVQLKVKPSQSPGRLKQWLGLMRRCYPQADALFQLIRATRHAHEVTPLLTKFLGPPEYGP